MSQEKKKSRQTQTYKLFFVKRNFKMGEKNQHFFKNLKFKKSTFSKNSQIRFFFF